MGLEGSEMSWPTKPEIEQACRNLWVGDTTQHAQVASKVLREIKNMRGMK
jgi:hypothetical protein